MDNNNTIRKYAIVIMLVVKILVTVPVDRVFLSLKQFYPAEKDEHNVVIYEITEGL